MPQAPLPAPAARTQPTELINPIVAGTPQAPDVLAHQKIASVWDAIGKGSEFAQNLVKLPREAAETAFQKSALAIQQEINKATMARIKDIQSNKNLDPVTRTNMMRQEGLLSGIEVNEAGARVNPNLAPNIYGPQRWIANENLNLGRNPEETNAQNTKNRVTAEQLRDRVTGAELPTNTQGQVTQTGGQYGNIPGIATAGPTTVTAPGQAGTGVEGSPFTPVQFAPTSFARGGIVTAPTLAMVGEAGPEAIIPLNRAPAMRYG